VLHSPAVCLDPTGMMTPRGVPSGAPVEKCCGCCARGAHGVYEVRSGLTEIILSIALTLPFTRMTFGISIVVPRSPVHGRHEVTGTKTDLQLGRNQTQALGNAIHWCRSSPPNKCSSVVCPGSYAPIGQSVEYKNIITDFDQNQPEVPQTVLN
jgi:hypothetical protein